MKVMLDHQEQYHYRKSIFLETHHFDYSEILLILESMKNQTAFYSLKLIHHFFFNFYFIFKLYIIVLVLTNIKMNPPQVYMCSFFKNYLRAY